MRSCEVSYCFYWGGEDTKYCPSLATPLHYRVRLSHSQLALVAPSAETDCDSQSIRMARSRSSSGCERKSPKISGGSFKESGNWYSQQFCHFLVVNFPWSCRLNDVSVGNSLRRFGQSIKRIVREVEEQSQGEVETVSTFSAPWLVQVLFRNCICSTWKCHFPTISHILTILYSYKTHEICKPLKNTWS